MCDVRSCRDPNDLGIAGYHSMIERWRGQQLCKCEFQGVVYSKMLVLLLANVAMNHLRKACRCLSFMVLYSARRVQRGVDNDISLGDG